jgi:hypothetical protein
MSTQWKKEESDYINKVLKENFLKRGFKSENWTDGNYTKLNGWELNRIWLLIKSSYELAQ